MPGLPPVQLFTLLDAVGGAHLVWAHVRAAAMTRGHDVGLLGLTHCTLARLDGVLTGVPIPSLARFVVAAAATRQSVADVPVIDPALADALHRAWSAPVLSSATLSAGLRRTLLTRTPVLRQLPVSQCARCAHAPGTGCFCTHCGLRVRLLSETRSAADAWLFGEATLTDRSCPSCSAGVTAATLWCGACGGRQTAGDDAADALRGRVVTVALHWGGRALGTLTGTVTQCWLETETTLPRFVCTFDTPQLDGVLIPGTAIAVALSPAGNDLVAPLQALAGGQRVAATPLRASRCVCGHASADRWCVACGLRVALFSEAELLHGTPALRGGACCAVAVGADRVCGTCGTRRAVVGQVATLVHAGWADDFSQATL